MLKWILSFALTIRIEYGRSFFTARGADITDLGPLDFLPIITSFANLRLIRDAEFQLCCPSLLHYIDQEAPDVFGATIFHKKKFYVQSLTIK